MECMDVSLADIIAVNMENPDDVVSEAHMARIARDMLRALCRIHRLHRIHRDIRSDNVLLSQRGEIKLSDFSHCAQLTKQQPNRNSIVGTPYWMVCMKGGLGWKDSIFNLWFDRHLRSSRAKSMMPRLISGAWVY